MIWQKAGCVKNFPVHELFFRSAIIGQGFPDPLAAFQVRWGPSLVRGGSQSKGPKSKCPRFDKCSVTLSACPVPKITLQCTMCCLYSLSSFQPKKLRHLCLDIPFSIYLSQLVLLEGKHDFRGNCDLQNLNLWFLGYLSRLFQKSC